MGAFVVGTGVAHASLGSTFQSISDRKKNAYEDSIQKLKQKFFNLYDGYEKKVIKEFNAKKEKAFEGVTSYLNMCYFPVELDDEQRKSLIDKYES